MKFDFKGIPTPCYLLDLTLLKRNLELLQYVQNSSGAKIICALKGFAMHSVFDIVGEYLYGGAASSLNEALLIKEKMKKPIYLYSPAYIPDEFEVLVQISSHITFNSLNQWNKYKNLAIGKVSCGLRVNPEYSEVKTDLYNPAIKGSRLGILSSILPEVLDEGIEGLHFHVLCENDSYTLERTLKHFEGKFSKYFKHLKWVNMGGGHLITREGYDVEHLINIIRRFIDKHNLEVILEPGEAVGWKTGYLISTVLDIVDSGGIRTAIIDSSFAAHMPDCLEMPYKPYVYNTIDDTKKGYKYRIGGITCLAGDYIGDYFFESELKEGDILVFDDMIHYTMVKNTTFNGVNLPSIGIIMPSGEIKIIKKFSYSDYKDRLS